MQRPDFSDIQSGAEFNQWYWLKEEMVNICKMANLPSAGNKFLLRDRIMYALDNHGVKMPESHPSKPTSTFKWSKEILTLDTIITDNVSFGPNFRGFFKRHLGKQFSCHADFMDWVKSNPGKSLKTAIERWQQLEQRKKDPYFQRQIAQQNMLSQYVRDFLSDHPDKNFKTALTYWKVKRNMPMKNGFVRYEKSDLCLPLSVP